MLTHCLVQYLWYTLPKWLIFTENIWFFLRQHCIRESWYPEFSGLVPVVFECFLLLQLVGD